MANGPQFRDVLSDVTQSFAGGIKQGQQFRQILGGEPTSEQALAGRRLDIAEREQERLADAQASRMEQEVDAAAARGIQNAIKIAGVKDPKLRLSLLKSLRKQDPELLEEGVVDAFAKADDETRALLGTKLQEALDNPNINNSDFLELAGKLEGFLNLVGPAKFEQLDIAGREVDPIEAQKLELGKARIEAQRELAKTRRQKGKLTLKDALSIAARITPKEGVDEKGLPIPLTAEQIQQNVLNNLSIVREEAGGELIGGESPFDKAQQNLLSNAQLPLESALNIIKTGKDFKQFSAKQRLELSNLARQVLRPAVQGTGVTTPQGITIE